jgi:hypothetical protein
MISIDLLKDVLSVATTDSDRALMCLANEPLKPRAVKEIVSVGQAAGWRTVKRLNISQLLARAKGNAVLVSGGWELTTAGKRYLAKLKQPLISCSPILPVASSLREHSLKIKSKNTQKFVDEAITCFEGRQFRAAVILSWVGAVALLQDHVTKTKLLEFNIIAKTRDAKWKNAMHSDDLGLMKEDNFLDILQELSILGKNVNQELKKALGLRNGCGHPNSLELAEHKVAAHIEDLILNVCSKFSPGP